MKIYLNFRTLFKTAKLPPSYSIKLVSKAFAFNKNTITNDIIKVFICESI